MISNTSKINQLWSLTTCCLFCSSPLLLAIESTINSCLTFNYFYFFPLISSTKSQRWSCKDLRYEGALGNVLLGGRLHGLQQGLFKGNFPRPHYAMIKLDHTLLELYGDHALQTTQNFMWSCLLFGTILKHTFYRPKHRKTSVKPEACESERVNHTLKFSKTTIQNSNTTKCGQDHSKIGPAPQCVQNCSRGGHAAGYLASH